MRDINIGMEITAVMKEHRVSKAELARRLEITAQSTDYLLKRKSIDTDTMYKISKALNFDFSELYRLTSNKENQINFDINQTTAKVLVEIVLNKDDMTKINLKDRVIQVLDK